MVGIYDFIAKKVKEEKDRIEDIRRKMLDTETGDIEELCKPLDRIFAVKKLYEFEKKLRRIFHKEMRIKVVGEYPEVNLHGLGSVFTFARSCARLFANGKERDEKGVLMLFKSCLAYHLDREARK